MIFLSYFQEVDKNSLKKCMFVSVEPSRWLAKNSDLLFQTTFQQWSSGKISFFGFRWIDNDWCCRAKLNILIESTVQTIRNYSTKIETLNWIEQKENQQRKAHSISRGVIFELATLKRLKGSKAT